MHWYRAISCLFVMATVVTTGCGRTCGDVWEDTKTCGRHMGRGVMALFGAHPHNGHPCSPEEFVAYEEDEFIPFADEDMYQGILRGDQLALLQIDADTAIPASRILPGEVGSSIPGIEGFLDPSSGEQANVFRRLHFDTDDYTIRGSENAAIVQKVAAYLKRHPDLYLFVEGHCDERGPAAYNLALGTRRANAIRNALIKEGIAPDRLLTISYGKERPLAVEHHAAAWKSNRRGQFKLHHHTGDVLCAR